MNEQMRNRLRLGALAVVITSLVIPNPTIDAISRIALGLCACDVLQRSIRIRSPEASAEVFADDHSPLSIKGNPEGILEAVIGVEQDVDGGVVCWSHGWEEKQE